MKTKRNLMILVSAVWLGAAAIFWGYLFLRNFPDGILSYCPVAADLEDGIVFEDRLRNYTMTYSNRHSGGSTYLQTWKAPIFSERWKSESYMGLLDLSSVSSTGKDTKTENYSEGLAELFPLMPGKEVTFTGVRQSRGKTWTIEYRVEVAASEVTSVGNCSYEVYPLQFNERITYPDGSVKLWEKLMYYSPELAYVLTDDSSRPQVFEEVRRPGLLESSDWPFNEEAVAN